ncbi:acyltransferase domain-containing protein [Streptomyces sp. NPDC088387]|uniref:acyltransferase domain-containing protein n=1 Tax=Streptomyces sp. NPDC088387 TaxID=3365859 RepID=UPI00382B59EF
MLPDVDDLPEVLLDLGVSHEDINELVAGQRTLTADAGAMRLLEECVEELGRDIGVIDPADMTGGEWSPDGFADRVAEGPEALGGLFAVYVFVATAPRTRAYHQELGIPADVSRRTLADLGRNMAVHRRRHGRTGFHVPWWISRHFRGELYQLGRLQFERARLGGPGSRALPAAGLDVAPGTPCLSLHIPDFHGPLSPAACDRSITLAREFFARYYPQEPPVAGVCHSWLLDPQLKRYLSAESNIVRFQDRFHVVPEDVEQEDVEPADRTPVQFVFGDPELAIAELPRRTAVERAVGDHLRAGGHWYVRRGWFPW